MRSSAAVLSHGDFLQAQVTSSQTSHSREHAACLDWAAWSRSGSTTGPTEGGHCPKLATPVKTWKNARDECLQARITAINPRNPTLRFASHVGTYQDPIEADQERDHRAGERIDEILHDFFGIEPRQVLHAVYVLTVPPYQWAEWARVKAHRFGQVFDFALANLGPHLTA